MRCYKRCCIDRKKNLNIQQPIKAAIGYVIHGGQRAGSSDQTNLNTIFQMGLAPLCFGVSAAMLMEENCSIFNDPGKAKQP
jgi:hypothetical protein